MTSQIAVFNLECVAVASDSVMTLESGQDRRTLASSEKIYDIGAQHRVIAMTSGEARFMKVPWSVLIAEWSRTLPDALGAVPDYAEAFVAWLPTRQDLFPADTQASFFAWQIEDYYLLVRERILARLRDDDLSDADWAGIDVQAAVNAVVHEAIEDLASRPDLPGTDPDRDALFLPTCESRVRERFDYVFDDVPRTVESDARLLSEIPPLVLSKDEPWGLDGTLAFIGYGNDDVFPGHQVVIFHGMVNDVVRASWWEPAAVDTESTSLVTPFAQTEAINTLLRAYNADFLRTAHRAIDIVWDEHFQESETATETVDAARQAIHERVNEDFERLSWERFVSPMLRTIDALSRSDMARMAESLVGVQALRAASTAKMPTVGGPIDVVVISRANGVEWVRRKTIQLD